MACHTAGFLHLPNRSAKPRSAGITHVLDKGSTLAATHELLRSVGDWIDIWKFGWGVAYVDPQLIEKLSALRRAGVAACTGGTLLEIAWLQGRVEAFFDFASGAGFECVEVSNGATTLPLAEKRELIVRARARGFTVLAEAGSKDPAKSARAEEWLDEMAGDLAAGATWLVAEGRESGTVGLYQSSGAIREPLLRALKASPLAARIIFEAPQRQQQAELLRSLGNEVNLGNIALDDVMGLETLRLGLRADTLGAFGVGQDLHRMENWHVRV